MNNRREYYYPVITYVLLLIIVWFSSWLVNIIGMISGETNVINSLVSYEGVRWAARSAMLSLNSVPWGTIMLFIAMPALLKGSGVMRLCHRLYTKTVLSKNEKRSLFFALSALLLYLLIIYIITFSPLNILLGVTGKIIDSPFMSGLPLLLFIGVLVTSLVYGFMYGNYRSLHDVVVSMGDTFNLFIPALMALIPASGIVPCIEYTGVLENVDCVHCLMQVITCIIYVLPFVYIILVNLRSCLNF